MRIAHVVYSPDSVANYAIMLILMACRNMPWIMKKADCQDYSLEGKVGFAALDTFEGEAGLYYLNKEGKRLDNDNMALLKSFPNVILSPHMAFYTEQAVSDMVENSIRGLLGFEQGDNSLEVK